MQGWRNSWDWVFRIGRRIGNGLERAEPKDIFEVCMGALCLLMGIAFLIGIVCLLVMALKGDLCGE